MCVGVFSLVGGFFFVLFVSSYIWCGLVLGLGCFVRLFISLIFFLLCFVVVVVVVIVVSLFLLHTSCIRRRTGIFLNPRSRRVTIAGLGSYLDFGRGPDTLLWE